MSMTIGRCSITEDPDAGSLRQRGDEVSFSSMIVGSSVDEMKARVQQLRGLMGNDDETVFPFTWSEDSSFDGFYTDFSVEVADQAVMLTSGVCPFSISMRRVGGYALPLAEATLSSVIRTNAHGVVAANSHLVVPPTTDNPGSFYASGSNTDMSSEDGTLFRNTRTGPVTNTFLPYGVLPADWYKGSSRVSVSYGGTYYPMVGQQIPSVTAVRIQNANFRIDVSSSAVFTLGIYHDSAWESSPSFIIRTSAAPYDSLANVRVLRNSPELAIVRLGLEASGASTSPCEVDVALHRGHQTACCLLSTYGGAASNTVSLRASAVTACTAITGGIERTTADASGNKWFILNTVASTNDLVNGFRTTNAAVASNLPFALGMFSTTFTTGDLSTTEVRDCFWGEYSETHRVVER